MSSLPVILVHGLVDSPYLNNDLAIFFWLLLAIMFTQYSSYFARRSSQAKAG